MGKARCKRCGKCCEVISLDYTKQALRQLARRELSRLAQDPDSPHRTEIQRLMRDVRFIDRHFHRVSRPRATKLNPTFGAVDYDGRRFYTCDRLAEGGSCREHGSRPFVCEAYPWYGSAPKRSMLVHTPCGYEAELGTASP